MKKIYAINGSPRKNGNTAQLLQKALDGAVNVEAESCFFVFLQELPRIISAEMDSCVPGNNIARRLSGQITVWNF